MQGFVRPAANSLFLATISAMPSEESLKISSNRVQEVRQSDTTSLQNKDKNKTIVVVNPGDSAKLDCPIPSELFGTKVSWIRRRDFHLLSVGDAVYSKDHRFFVSHSRHSHYQGSRHSQVWFLHLRNVTDIDEGEYECQTSNHPSVSTIFYLKVQNAFSLIIGPQERVVASGSELKLICSFENASKALSYVFWYQGKKMINYDLFRGVVVSTEKKFSTLTISTTNASHAGNYTCEPSNAAPSFVMVHVVEGENSDLTGSHPEKDERSREGVAGRNSDAVLTSGGNRAGHGVADDKSVRQLGVKSASSTSAKSHSQGAFPAAFSLGLLLNLFIHQGL